MKLVIVAGGKGKRLGAITKKVPKPMVKVSDVTFLEYLILFYSKFDLEKIFIMTGYKSSIIYNKFNKKFFNGVEIICIRENKPMGNFGCLNKLKNKIHDNYFLYANGDSIIDLDITKIIKNKTNFICLTKAKKTDDNKLSIKNKFLNINNKGKFKSAGLHLLNKTVLKLANGKFLDFEKDIVPTLIKYKKIKGKLYNNFFVDIGTKKNLLKLRKKLKKKIPGLFLDRDGTINKDNGYTYKTKDLKIILKTIKYIKKNTDKRIFVITNQSGIARGYFTTIQMYKFYRKLKKNLIKKKIYINDYQWCPHHPNAKIKKYKKNCNRRKPNNKMIEDLIKKWNIERKKSVMIGNSDTDYLAAKKSRIKFINIKNI
jgi:D,D-heptose 1,7-bisphosphate phosphatase